MLFDSSKSFVSGGMALVKYVLMFLSCFLCFRRVCFFCFGGLAPGEMIERNSDSRARRNNEEETQGYIALVGGQDAFENVMKTILVPVSISDSKILQTIMRMILNSDCYIVDHVIN